MPRKTRGELPQSLIPTKLNPPQLDTRLISRLSLVDSLLGEEHRSMLSIVASAGSGKSTLMAQLHRSFQETGIHTSWLSLDADDNNPESFAAYFVSALGLLETLAMQGPLTQQRASPPPDIEALFESLIVQVACFTSDAALFIDDFQHITDGRIQRFISKLMVHSPRSFRLIIASRTDLPLDLARSRISGRLAEIKQDELNFNPTQAADFLKRSHDLELSPSELETLHATTEGWPVGLQLAAIALRRHRGPASDLIKKFSGRDKDLTSYLVECVLQSQPETVRTFLLRTAPLRRMSRDLCQAISGHPTSGEMLAYLAHSNLFIIALDRNGEWYRYHHLFAEFLQDELRRTAPDTFQDICDRAVEWCEANGHTTEAIQYALEGHRNEKASDLIAEHAPTVSRSQGDHYTVLDWMRRLPEAFHGRRAEISLSHAWSLAFSRDTDRSIALLEQVLARLRDEGPHGWVMTDSERRHALLVARVTQAVATATADRIDECLSQSIELRKQLPESEPLLISTICSCMSYCHYARREFESSAGTASDGYLYGNLAAAVYLMTWADFLHGLADIELGRLRTAQEHARRAVENSHTEDDTVTYTTAMAALINAEVATQRCEFDRARGFLEIGRVFSASFGPTEPLLVALRNEARVIAWGGGLEEGRQVLMRGQDTALRTAQPRLFIALAIEEATLQLCGNDVAGADETARRTRLWDNRKSLTPSCSVTRGIRESLQLLEARFLIAQEAPGAALRIINLLQQTPTAQLSGLTNLTLKTIKACALWQCDRNAEALRELDRALTAAAQELHAYPIISAGKTLIPILRAIRERRHDALVNRELESKRILEDLVLDLLSGDGSSRADVHVNAVQDDPIKDSLKKPTNINISASETLSQREIQILQLLDSGLTNEAVASQLFLSLRTIKWYLYNIYPKLGVTNRTGALSKARRLRII